MGDKIHEIRKGGNLFFLLNAAIGAYNRRTDALSEGMEAIALALSTPEDNSAQVMEQVARIRVVREKLQSSVDSQTKGE